MILECGHSFCTGCITRIKEEAVFNRPKTINKLFKFFYEDYTDIALECPKCKALFKISKYAYNNS